MKNKLVSVSNPAKDVAPAAFDLSKSEAAQMRDLKASHEAAVMSAGEATLQATLASTRAIQARQAAYEGLRVLLDAHGVVLVPNEQWTLDYATMRAARVTP